MKILNVNTLIDVSKGGGTAQRTIDMSYYLQEAGEDCSILTLDLGITDELRKRLRNVKITALRCLNKRFYLPYYKKNEIYELVKDADIIHLMNYWSILNVIIYFYAKKLRTPYVICPAGSLCFFGRSKFFKLLFHHIIGRKILSDSSLCIAVTDDEKEDFIKMGIEESKIILIPNGINEVPTQSYENSKVLEDKNLEGYKYIFYLGRLNPIKGIDLLVQAFVNISAKHKNYHLIVAGPDEGMLAGLKSFAQKNGLHEKIHFVGTLNFEEKYKMYKEASLLVIPSRQEAMSIVVLEAGIVRTPVVLTDRCGLNELGRNECAIVTEPNAKSLEIGIDQALSNEGFMSESGTNLFKFILSNYTWNSITKKYIDSYKKLI